MRQPPKHSCERTVNSFSQTWRFFKGKNEFIWKSVVLEFGWFSNNVIMSRMMNLLRLFIAVSSLAGVLNQDHDELTFSKSGKKWFSQIFAEAEGVFGAASNVNAKCKKDLNQYRMHLRNQTVWAVRMMESSDWPSVGLFGGISYHMGNWDECLHVRGPNGVRGQYCLVQTSINFTLNLELGSSTPAWIDWPDEEASAWNVIKMYEKNPIRISRHVYTWALCAPSSCGVKDLKESLNYTLSPVFKKYGFSVTVDIHPAVCKVDEDRPFSNGFYYTIALYISIISVMILATFYDLLNNKKKEMIENRLSVELFRCFSAVQSYERLTHYSSTTTYSPVNLVKIIYMILIIYGHRLLLMNGFPPFHSEQIEMTYSVTNPQLVQTDIVDVFFMVTGYLTFHFGVTPMEKGGAVYLVFSIVFRWIRLIPTFGLAMLFFMYILPYTSDGPFWTFFVRKRIGDCEQSWWTNMLAINNIVKADLPCLPIGWYVAVDMQLTIIGSVLLLIIVRSKKSGYFLTAFMFVFSAVITSCVVFIKQYYGLPRWFMSSLEDPILLEEFYNFYIKSYPRLGPYIVGFATAALTRELRQRKYKFSGVQMIILIIFSFVIGLGFPMYGLLFFKVGRPYYPLENAIYAALHRPVSVLPIACLHCIYFTSGLGVLNKIIKWKIYLPFGRLTYCVLLTSYVLQIYHILSQRSYLPTIGGLNTFWWTGSDILYSFIFAFLVYLISEGPLNNFSKLLQKGLIKKFLEPRKDTEKVSPHF